MKKHTCTKICLLLLVVVLTALLSGCSGSASSYAENAEYGNYQEEPRTTEQMPGQAIEEAPKEEFATAASTPAAAPNNTSASAPVVVDANRKIILNADAKFETLEFDSTIAKLTQYLEEAGGRVKESQTDNSAYSTRRATYTFNIPASNYSSFIKNISSLEHLLSLNESSDDVTRQYVDTEARIKSLTIQKERLEEYLSRAETVEDLITLQNRLSSVQYEIESYTANKLTMDELVTYSTVTVTVKEVEIVTEPTPPTPVKFSSKLVRALQNGWNGTVDFVQGFILFTAEFLPLILLLIAIIVLAIILHKRAKKAAAHKAAKGYGFDSSLNQDSNQPSNNEQPKN